MHKTGSLWASLLSVLGLRLLVASRLPLTLDEPYYWQWARHLAAGYYDHPPLSAWLGAPLAGLAPLPLIVRLSCLVAGIATALFVFAYTRRLFGENAAVLAGVGFLVAPYYSVMGILLSPEPALLMCWAWSLAAWHAALFSEDARPGPTALRWIGAGAATGCALLAKFTAFALPVQLGMFFAAAPQARRRWLRSGHLLLATAAALLVLSPFLAWDAGHHWQTFLFQVAHREVGAQLHIRPGRILSFLLESAGGLSPLVFAALLAAIPWAWRRAAASEPVRLALAMSLPTLIAFALLSAVLQVQVYWTLCGYLSLFPLAGAWLAERLDGQGRRAWTSAGLAAVAVAVLPLAAATAVVCHPTALFTVFHNPRGSGVTEIYGMDALADYLRRDRATMPHPSRTFYAAEDHRLASHLSLRLSDFPLLISDSPRGREYLRWQDADRRAGDDALFLHRHRLEAGAPVFRAFDRVRDEPPRTVYFDGHVARVFRVARGWGFHPERIRSLLRPP